MTQININRHLSPHFTLREMIKSQTASRHGIENMPDADAIDNLSIVCRSILEPIRAHYKIPFSPQSGFRSVALNSIIGGSRRSQHMHGQAVDIELPGVDNLQLAMFIESQLEFDQLILECYEPGDTRSGWVHVSITKGSNRRQSLTYNRNHGYAQGLIHNNKTLNEPQLRRA